MAEAKSWVVYRLYSAADRLLYLGYSNNLRRRLQEQRNLGLCWWGEVVKVTSVECESKASAVALAWAGIQSESPLWNKLRRKVGDPKGDGKTSCLVCGAPLPRRVGRGRRYRLCGAGCALAWQERSVRVKRLAGVRARAGLGSR
jgi:hypothetical protein